MQLKEHDRKVVGARIKEIRNALSLNQMEFAKSFDIGRADLSRLENGIITPSFFFILKMSEIYHINLYFLFHGQGELFVKENPQENLK